MVYIRPLELSHLMFYVLWPIPPQSPPHPKQQTFLQEFGTFRFHIQVRLHNTCLSLSELSHLAYALKRHSCCYKWADFLLCHGWILCHHTYTYRTHMNIYIHTHFVIHLYSSAIDTDSSISWPFQIMLHWTLQYREFFQILIPFPLAYFPEVGMPDPTGVFIGHLSSHHSWFPYG